MENFNIKLNSGVKINMHPVVLTQIAQFAHRKQIHSNSKCIGTLLGHVYPNYIEVTNCFTIPLENEEAEEDAYIRLSEEMTYHKKLVEMNQKVYPSEIVIGAFLTVSKTIPRDILTLTQSYQNASSLFIPQRMLRMPLIVQIDPFFTNGTLDLKGYIYDDNLEFLVQMIGNSPFKTYPINVTYKNEQIHEVVPFIFSEDDEQKNYDLLKLHNFNELISNIIVNLQKIKQKLERIIKKEEPSDEKLGVVLKNLINLSPLTTNQEFLEMSNQYENDIVLLLFLTNLAKSHNVILEKLNLVRKK